MGQRLVITIKDKGEDKMKVYYHWAGYTMSAFDELKNLWDIIKPLKKAGKTTEEILLRIIHGLEGNVDETMQSWLETISSDQAFNRSCHGGIGYFNKDSRWDDKVQKPNLELEYIQALYPNETFSKYPDRNNGLVYMSKDGMKDAQDWSEGNAEINIDTETFNNDIYWVHNSKDEYIADMACDYDKGINANAQAKYEEKYNSIPTYNSDGSKLFKGKCDNIRACADTIYDLVDNNGYEFKDEKGAVWELTA